MTESYVLQDPEDLDNIEKLGDDFFIFIMNGTFVCYYIYPSCVFIDTYNVYDNKNNFVTSYSSIVEAVNFCFNELKIYF